MLAPAANRMEAGDVLPLALLGVSASLLAAAAHFWPYIIFL